MTVIEMGLSTNSIDSAITQLKKYISDIDSKAGRAAMAVAEEGRDYAVNYLNSALPVAVVGSWTTGELARSIEAVRTQSGASVVASGQHAAFVEFGTGVRGAANPYPGNNGWAYDVAGHGEEGWMFPDPSSPTGETWTQGLPSTPYMWTTAEYLRQVGGAIAAREWL